MIVPTSLVCPCRCTGRCLWRYRSSTPGPRARFRLRMSCQQRLGSSRCELVPMVQLFIGPENRCICCWDLARSCRFAFADMFNVNFWDLFCPCRQKGSHRNHNYSQRSQGPGAKSLEHDLFRDENGHKSRFVHREGSESLKPFLFALRTRGTS